MDVAAQHRADQYANAYFVEFCYGEKLDPDGSYEQVVEVRDASGGKIAANTIRSYGLNEKTSMLDAQGFFLTNESLPTTLHVTLKKGAKRSGAKPPDDVQWTLMRERDIALPAADFSGPNQYGTRGIRASWFPSSKAMIVTQTKAPQPDPSVAAAPILRPQP
jgi:hypothetical protein